MSCFEQSTFLQNAAIVNQEILLRACTKMNWQTEQRNGELWVSQSQSQATLFGEPILRLKGNTVIWNTYYQTNGMQQVDALRSTYMQLYNEMRVEYAREAILSEFRKVGFSFVDDLQFHANDFEKYRFSMKGRSKLKGETEPVSSIQFTILSDGTVRTSSDYIPEDIHILADEAMATLENTFGNPRAIQPKDIPAKYRGKTFCHAKTNVQLKQGRK